MAIQIRRGTDSEWESNKSNIVAGEPAVTLDTGRFFVGTGSGEFIELQKKGEGDALTEDVKQALLQIASKVAYIDDDGQDYYDALESALYHDATLVSISAVYTQSGTVYDTDSLDSLKADLVVTATYDDATTATVTAYTLSGTLTVGTSTITVAYGGKTTTFNVTVTAWDVEWDYTDGSPLNNGFVNTTAVTGSMVSTGYQMGPVTSGSSGCTLAHSPDVSYTKGVIETIFTITQMAVIDHDFSYNGFAIFMPGFRIRMYNNIITADYSSTNTPEDRITIGTINANAEHTLRIEYNKASSVTVFLDGIQIYNYSGSLNASTTRFLLNATNKHGDQLTPPTVVVSAIRCKEVA